MLSSHGQGGGMVDGGVIPGPSSHTLLTTLSLTPSTDHHTLLSLYQHCNNNILPLPSFPSTIPTIPYTPLSHNHIFTIPSLPTSPPSNDLTPIIPPTNQYPLQATRYTTSTHGSGAQTHLTTTAHRPSANLPPQSNPM